MSEPIFVLTRFTASFLNLLSIIMLIRMVFGMFFEGDGPIIRYIYVVTEPVVMPFRKLFEKRGWFEESPFDIAGFTAFMIISVLELIVEVLVGI